MAQLADRIGAISRSVLSVKRGRWRARGGVEPSEREFQNVRQRALARDDHTCKECGIRVSVGMEVHHKNDIHEDNDIHNLVTECPLCHATHHIGFIGKNGMIILLPEVEQRDLFNLLRAASIAYMKGDAEQKKAALKIFDLMKACGQDVKASWGSNATLDFANCLMSLPDGVYSDRGITMQGLRLSVNREVMTSGKFQHIELVQRDGEPFGDLPPQTWGTLCSKIDDEMMRRVSADREVLSAKYDDEKRRRGEV